MLFSFRFIVLWALAAIVQAQIADLNSNGMKDQYEKTGSCGGYSTTYPPTYPDVTLPQCEALMSAWYSSEGEEKIYFWHAYDEVTKGGVLVTILYSLG